MGLASLSWVGEKHCHCGTASETAAWGHEQLGLSHLEAAVQLFRKYPKCWGCTCKEKSVVGVFEVNMGLMEVGRRLVLSCKQM